MKKKAILLVFFTILSAAPISLPAYDNSPAYWKAIPECIWATASGGGTWVTEIQITNMTATTAPVNARFYYGGGLESGIFVLTTALPSYSSYKSTNILATLDNLDSSALIYYGKVGTLWVWTDNDHRIIASAKIVNGNYGKTFPGLTVNEASTAAVGRNMIIHNLTHNTTYRTFTGFSNTSVSATYTVNFYLINAADTVIGAFAKTFVPLDYMAFNPFVEAGIGGGAYDNCYLYVIPATGGTTPYGIMCFGAIANNISNDPSAIIAYPYN